VNAVLAAVAVALLVALAAIGVLAAEEDEEPEQAAAPSGVSLEQVTERVGDIAGDVERVRELEFDRLPRVTLVDPEEAGRASVEELDRQVPRSSQRVAERLLAMLGLVPPGTRLRDVIGTALTEEVAGYYLPRTGTLALVRGGALEGFVAEVTLAHELTHALEDQRFGIDSPGVSDLLRDSSSADAALIEGSATLAMVEYVILTQAGGRELPPAVRSRVLEQMEGIALPASSGLPRYVRESLVFPYAAGAGFVDRLEQRGGWAAVNRAFGEEAPVSTEQIMHPRKYAAGERPVRVRLGPYRSELPQGARVVARGDLGEFDTAQFLLDANGRRRSEEAAEGWGGSTFQLWRLRGGGDLLVMAWTWDTPRDAAEFAAAARRTVGRLDAAGAVNDGNEGVVAVVLAPEAALARRVARRIGR
jgi:hypothetical protein